MGRSSRCLLPALVLLLTTAGVSAEPRPRPDPTSGAGSDSPGSADSLAIGAPVADSLSLAPLVRDPERPARSERPDRPSSWSVTVRSGLVPGWGQFVNQKPLKGTLLLGLDAYWLGRALHYENERKQMEERNDVEGVNDAVDKRNGSFWLMGATALYAMLDAYVDSYFADYDEGWTGRIGLDPEGNAVAALSYKF